MAHIEWLLRSEIAPKKVTTQVSVKERHGFSAKDCEVRH